MGAYWCQFANGKRGCVEASDETTAKVAGRMAVGSDVVVIDKLPYPAEPRLVKVLREYNGQSYHIPSFCYQPERCKGCGSCPERYSCVE